jgi:hypothetical protein
MNFKRPCWLALFVSLGMMLVGYFAFWGMMSYWGDQNASTLHMLIGTALFLLMAIGAFGFAASLIWWFTAAVVLRFRSSHQKKPRDS